MQGSGSGPVADFVKDKPRKVLMCPFCELVTLMYMQLDRTDTEQYYCPNCGAVAKKYKPWFLCRCPSRKLRKRNLLVSMRTWYLSCAVWRMQWWCGVSRHSFYKKNSFRRIPCLLPRRRLEKSRYPTWTTKTATGMPARLRKCGCVKCVTLWWWCILESASSLAIWLALNSLVNARCN